MKKLYLLKDDVNISEGIKHMRNVRFVRIVFEFHLFCIKLKFKHILSKQLLISSFQYNIMAIYTTTTLYYGWNQEPTWQSRRQSTISQHWAH